MWAVAAFACLFAILRSRSSTIALAIAVGFAVWTCLYATAVRAERHFWQLIWFFATGLVLPGLFIAGLAAL
jgi:hypothetical protein